MIAGVDAVASVGGIDPVVVLVAVSGTVAVFGVIDVAGVDAVGFVGIEPVAAVGAVESADVSESAAYAKPAQKSIWQIKASRTNFDLELSIRNTQQHRHYSRQKCAQRVTFWTQMIPIITA